MESGQQQNRQCAEFREVRDGASTRAVRCFKLHGHDGVHAFSSTGDGADDDIQADAALEGLAARVAAANAREHERLNAPFLEQQREEVRVTQREARRSRAVQRRQAAALERIAHALEQLVAARRPGRRRRG